MAQAHAKLLVALCALLPAFGCSLNATIAPQASAPIAAAAPVAAPVDPFASSRPTTESVGVVMPDAKNFPHPWDVSTYVLRVTQFGVMPPLNGGVAFVGDSLTDWMRWNELFPKLRSRNFGIAGDTTVGLQHRISQVIAAKPAVVFLMIGTNDIEFGRTPEQIVANIDSILDSLSAGLPGTKVIVENLLPRQPQYNDRVVVVNTLLKAEAEKRSLAYIDLYAHFVTEGGRLDPSLTPDDLHLSGQGYLRWQSLIADEIAAALPNKPIPAHSHKRHAHRHKG